MRSIGVRDESRVGSDRSSPHPARCRSRPFPSRGGWANIAHAGSVPRACTEARQTGSNASKSRGRTAGCRILFLCRPPPLATRYRSPGVCITTSVSAPRSIGCSTSGAIACSPTSSASPAASNYLRWHDRMGVRDEIAIWCSNDYLGMGQHPKVDRGDGETPRAWAPAPAAPATSPAPTIRWSSWRPSWPTCTARRRRSSSPRASFRTKPAISTIAGLLPDCLILSDELNHDSMIEGVRRSGCDKQIFRHNDLGASRGLLHAAGRSGRS